MSFDIYVVPENHKLDQHIIRPLFERLVEESEVSGRPDVRFNHHTGSFTEIRDVLPEIAVKYGHYDAVVVVPDRDCSEDRRERVNGWFEADELADFDVNWVSCLAIEEVEVWLLALYVNELDEYWEVIRDECDPKEIYFEPFMEENGDPKSPGGGRRQLVEAGLEETSFSALLQKCEELAELQEKLEEAHGT